MPQISSITKFGNKSVDSYLLGNIVGKAYVLSAEDLGSEKEVIKRRGEAFLKRLGEYGRYLKSIDEKMLNSRGVYFYLIVYFSELVAEKGNMNDRVPAPQSFDIFDYAKQVYRTDEKVLMEMVKKVEFLD